LNGIQIVRTPRHEIADETAQEEPPILFLKMAEQIVSELVFHPSRDTEERLSPCEPEDGLATDHQDNGPEVEEELTRRGQSGERIDRIFDQPGRNETEDIRHNESKKSPKDEVAILFEVAENPLLLGNPTSCPSVLHCVATLSHLPERLL
jgi:hypothetical protein